MSRLARVRFIVLAIVFGALPAMAAPSTTSGVLLYSQLTDGTWQIWQTDLATQQRVQLTTSAGDKRYPAWVGHYGVTYHTSNYESYRVQSAQSPAPVLASVWPVRDLAWSPDGARVAFARVRTDLVDSANLWVADADGKEPLLLTHEAGIQYNPAWSPDGRRLVYVAGHGYGTYELYSINADGTDQRRLTTNTSHEFLPAWSPDGAQIAYTSDASGDYEIWVMRADGSNLRQLTHTPGLDTRPAWSPDGTQLAFTTNRAGLMEIWIMNADGTNPHVLEHSTEGACDPAWRS